MRSSARSVPSIAARDLLSRYRFVSSVLGEDRARALVPRGRVALSRGSRAAAARDTWCSRIQSTSVRTLASGWWPSLLGDLLHAGRAGPAPAPQASASHRGATRLRAPPWPPRSARPPRRPAPPRVSSRAVVIGVRGAASEAASSLLGLGLALRRGAGALSHCRSTVRGGPGASARTPRSTRAAAAGARRPAGRRPPASGGRGSEALLAERCGTRRAGRRARARARRRAGRRSRCGPRRASGSPPAPRGCPP